MRMAAGNVSAGLRGSGTGQGGGWVQEVRHIPLGTCSHSGVLQVGQVL